MTIPALRISKMKHVLEEKLQPNYLEIIDESYKHVGHEGAASGGGHFYLKISSPLFAHQALIQCHRMIYDALQSFLPHEIHALRIKILPE